MSRRAVGRDTYLTADEIAGEALRQLDERLTEPTIRSIAAALGVGPTAIYHHYPSRAAIFQAAVEQVWNGAFAEAVRLVPAPFEADPTDVLIVAALATRRAWLAHHRLARYMTATPEANEFTADALSVMGSLFERLGLTGEQAAEGFHNYASFMIGAVLFAADRKIANEQLGRIPTHSNTDNPGPPPAAEHVPPPSNAATRTSMNEMMDLSITDPARDEELYVRGLRRLIAGLTGETAPDPPTTP
jgi:AcrR family transcriptional regulator